MSKPSTKEEQLLQWANIANPFAIVLGLDNPFTFIADAFDNLVKQDEVFLENHVFKPFLIHAEEKLKNPNTSLIGVAGVVGSGYLMGLAYTSFKVPTITAQGFADVLRIGNGLQKGTFGGVFEDVSRALFLAPELGNLIKYGPPALSYLVRNSKGPMCVWITAAKALRQAGVRLWITIEALQRTPWSYKILRTPYTIIKNSKTGLEATHPNLFAKEMGGIDELSQIKPVLEVVGARTKLVKIPTKNVNRVTEELTQLLLKENGVAIVDLKWVMEKQYQLEETRHAVLAFVDNNGILKFSDRTGIVFRDFSQLEKYYPNISAAKFNADALIVKNGIHIKTLGDISRQINLFGQIALPMKVGFIEVEKVIDKMSTAIQKIKSSQKIGRFFSDRTCHQEIPDSSQFTCPSERYFFVTKASSLAEVAEYIYGDSGLWRKIYEANIATLGASQPGTRVVQGQVLIIRL